MRIQKRFFLILLGMLALQYFYINNAFSTSITVNSDITANTTWSVDTVFITGDFQIWDGVTLSIDPGTYVEYQGYYLMDVKGCLLANGVEGDTIIFTIHDTTDWTLLNSTSGGFRHIEFINVNPTNDTSVFKYCSFLYGKTTDGMGNDDRFNNGGAVYIENTERVNFEHCSF